ncbi:MAG: DNA-3-methyladenine glycosylase [Oscillospiraceae bacterium]|nr:DNA-3-methyladenine glycosylase [Oscillospiraceae bacterium]
MKRLDYDFFHRHALEVAPELVGKLLVHNGQMLRISETEAYCGETDTACHASKGRTKRTEVLYMEAGTIYIYLCYGMHWLMNVITGDADDPQGVLIRACVEANGPGKLTKHLGITGVQNRGSIVTSPDLWIADDGFRCSIRTDKRVGIGYASEEDQAKHWRFILDQYE